MKGRGMDRRMERRGKRGNKKKGAKEEEMRMERGMRRRKMGEVTERWNEVCKLSVQWFRKRT